MRTACWCDHTAGLPVPVAVLRPGLPVEVASLFDGALGIGEPRARLRTAVAFQRVIEQLLADHDSTVLPPPTDGGSTAPEDIWHTATFAKITTTPTPRRKLSAGLITLTAALAVLLVYLAGQVAEICGITWTTRAPVIVVPATSYLPDPHPAGPLPARDHATPARHPEPAAHAPKKAGPHSDAGDEGSAVGAHHAAIERASQGLPPLIRTGRRVSLTDHWCRRLGEA